METANTETPRDQMRRDIRGWGLALIVLGGIHILLSGFLDPIWGGIIIVVGVSCLIIRQRGMYILLGAMLVIVGIMNILFTQLGGWTAFGVFQIGFGIHQARKFWRYGTQPVTPSVQ